MTNPYTAIGCAAWHPPDWGWGFSYHEVAWSGNGGNEDFIYDACLQYDGDENPNSWPKTAVLPAGVLFSDGDPESPLVYRERLTPPDENGYESCVALPSMRMRRSLK